uniref:C2H2-type domain-containing protein n=1 Tax=Panagrolaimus superbus TaxID=310955 RepID=A0A914YZ27_9BILA
MKHHNDKTKRGERIINSNVRFDWIKIVAALKKRHIRNYGPMGLYSPYLGYGEYPKEGIQCPYKDCETWFTNHATILPSKERQYLLMEQLKVVNKNFQRLHYLDFFDSHLTKDHGFEARKKIFVCRHPNCNESRAVYASTELRTHFEA